MFVFLESQNKLNNGRGYGALAVQHTLTVPATPTQALYFNLGLLLSMQK